MKNPHRLEIATGSNVVKHYIGDVLRAEIPADQLDNYRKHHDEDLPEVKEVAAMSGAVDLNAMVAAEVQKQVEAIVAAQLKAQGSKSKH